MTIHSLITELQTWFSPSPEILAAAKSSKITSKNNLRFKALVRDWMNGSYDEDPGILYNEVVHLLKK